MRLQDYKLYIFTKLNGYLGGTFRVRRHSDRAKKLHLFVSKSTNLRDISFRIINEHSLFNLGYSLLNVNEDKAFEHEMKNINLQGKYYRTVISPAFEYLIADESNLSCKEPIKSASNYNKTLIFRNNAHYANNLRSILNELNIKYKELESGDAWIRDTLFVGNDNVYIRTKDDPDINSPYSIYQESELNLLNKSVAQGKSLRDVETFLVTSKYLSLSERVYDKKEYVPRLQDHKFDRSLGDNVYSGSKKDSIRLLEGGNLFEVINNNGEKYYFIGVNTLLSEIDLKNFKDGTIDATDTLTHRKILAKCNTELERYKKIFDTDNVIILPQWTYHLDLQMSYVGKSTFFIHSFSKVKGDASEVTSSHKNGCMYRAMAENAMEREPIIRYISAILRSCGFNTELYAGVLHNYQRKVRLSGRRYILANTIYAMGDSMDSSFVNGIDVYSSNKNEYYFLTLDSPNDDHKKYLKKLLCKYGITPKFLRINNRDPRQTLNIVSELHGALRCQTNFLPNERL